MHYRNGIKTGIARLKSPRGRALVLFCLLLLLFLLSNQQLYFDAPNDALGNWIYIFYFLCAAIVLFFLRFLLFPWDRSRSQISFSQVLIYSVLFGSLWYFTLEVIYNEVFFQIEGKYVFWGIFIASAFFIALLLLFNSLCAASIAGSIFFLIWALGEHYTQLARGIPVQVHDLMDIPTAMEVAGNYKYPLTAEIITMVLLLIMACANTIMCKRLIVSFDIRRKLTVRCSGIVLMAMLLLSLLKGSSFDSLEVNIDGNIPAASFRTYGTELAFVEGARESHIEVPSSYSVNELNSIASEFTADESADSSPNIIVIMNETFADIDLNGTLGLADTVLPNYYSLKENTQKGKVLVSTLGGGTGKSEYEFLTGNSMHLYSSFISPYVRLGSRLNFSMADVLSDQGYATYAIHPYTASNYNRAVTYDAMGFDRFFSLEDFPNAKYIHGFISDKSCYKKIYQLVDETDSPVFSFCVTIQNHSPYNNKEGFRTKVNLDGDYTEAEEYLTLLKESDRQIGKLINHFRNCDEDTMIVFFGDHFPALSDEFWENAVNIRNTEEDMDMKQLFYATPFFIWTNYDIEEKSDMMISTNYLGAYAMDLAGVRLTAYQRYLLSLRKTIPAFNAFGYYGRDEHFHSFDSDEQVKKDIDDYDGFQYNEIFDRKHIISDFFELPQN